MLKRLAAILLVVPVCSHAMTTEDGCKTLATHAEVISLAKEFGLGYDKALAWVADLPYVEPWSGMLAATVEWMYTSPEANSPDTVGESTYLACVGTLGKLN